MNNPLQNTRCDFCGKKAIGTQILGFVRLNVCEDHAEKELIAMNPGEQKAWGECYFIRNK